jgi:hypothetical protein
VSQNVPGLTTGQPAIEPFFQATQEMLSAYVSPNFRLVATSATKVGIAAGTGHNQVSIAIEGKYRYITALIESAAVSGAAGGRDVFVTASANDFSGSAPTIDLTNYAFALAVVATGATPSGVALSRKVGELDWSGAAITAVRQLVNADGSAHALTGSDPLPANSVGATQIADGTVGWAEAASALKPSQGAGGHPDWEALRALGATGDTAAAGNDPRFSDAPWSGQQNTRVNFEPSSLDMPYRTRRFRLSGASVGHKRLRLGYISTDPDNWHNGMFEVTVRTDYFLGGSLTRSLITGGYTGQGGHLPRVDVIEATGSQPIVPKLTEPTVESTWERRELYIEVPEWAQVTVETKTNLQEHPGPLPFTSYGQVFWSPNETALGSDPGYYTGLSPWHPLFERSVDFNYGWGNTRAILLKTGGLPSAQPNSSAAVYPLPRLDELDGLYARSPRTVLLRMRVLVKINAVTPGVAFTFHLNKSAAGNGGSGQPGSAALFGTSIANVVIDTAGAASYQEFHGLSAEVGVPSDARFLDIVAAPSGAPAGNSFAAMFATVEYRAV